MEVKLGDFGLAAKLEKPEEKQKYIFANIQKIKFILLE